MADVTYLEALRQGLWEEMERDPRVFILGEDVGAYGGAFKVTEGFVKRFGEQRVLGHVAALRDQPMEQILTAIYTELAAFTGGASASDDRTVVLLKA